VGTSSGHWPNDANCLFRGSSFDYPDYSSGPQRRSESANPLGSRDIQPEAFRL
jgi:hypothetical protein